MLATRSLSALVALPFALAATGKCSDKPDGGLCKALFTKYYFDGTKCTTFNWGGCGGTVPFDTLEECQKSCSPTKTTSTKVPETTAPVPPCEQKPEVGPCRAAIPAYYFDKDAGKCSEFTWGGCDGNVPFKTFDECAKSCPTSTPVPPCQQKPDPGMCEAAIPRYYFDSVTGKCTLFVWGGCGGNVPFQTLEECSQSCAPVDPVPPCKQKPDPGMCLAAFQRYYFDSTTGKCTSFVWGGCAGNVPFQTLDECLKACPTSYTSTTTVKPSETPVVVKACASKPCKKNYDCVESPKQCFTTPCPQYDCLPTLCSQRPCAKDERCVSDPKQCKTLPCPQYKCVSKKSDA